ncbi:FG-GAP-like repeat-containing protein [Desulfotignum phosphitoxidans]|uniref:Integrin-like repeat-containing protein n=1 Tax=Desulfotignum phosphitoxidans DSM 13687 TaxID=1286635 RepID=S0FUA4_9BACT|nr:FG-GAP-like repeat-containing protein [Desulfotignum phosphitoxidans]EMS78658.1 integrin-like repeat-containing protein [Desulfotignum phosphitoxidans DSM 13687]
MRSRLFAAFTGCLVGCFMLAAMVPAVSAAPKTVAVLPFTMNSPQDLTFLRNGLFSMLSSRLSDPGKVDVLDRAAVDDALTGRPGDLTQDAARNIGERLGADYVLFGSLTHFGESVSLDAAMVDITGDKPALTFFEQSNNMGDVIPLVNTFAGDINQKVFNRSIANELYAQPVQEGPRAPGGFQSTGGQGGFVNLQQTGGGGGFATHLSLDMVINAMAVGDLTDDGTLQVVAATDNTLMIHQMSDNHLVLEKQLEFSSNHRIVALDIADINGNGYPEIFVTSFTIHLDGLQSFVVEYNGSDYVTITDNQHYYYRVIDAPDGSQTLMGQRSSKDPFDGPVYIMQAEGSSYTRQKQVRLPRNTSVLSLAKGPVTKESAEEYVMINRFGRLVVTDDGGSEQWESTEKYGGTAHVWLMPKNDPDGSYRERVYIHPRIQFVDMTGEDKPEIVAVQNNEFGGGALGRYKRFENGTIQVLSWNGIALAPMFETLALQGWISDFAVADIDADGKDELIVSVVTQTKLAILAKDKSSSIISYELD